MTNSNEQEQNYAIHLSRNLQQGGVLCLARLLRPTHLLCADGLLRADRLLHPGSLLRANLLRAIWLLRPTAAEGRLRNSMTVQPTTDAIWTHFSSDLRRFIRRRVADDHVADDLLQETFMRVHRNIGSLQKADRLAAWVYQIARNVVHDHHRKAKDLTVALADADPADDCDDHLAELRCRGIGWLDEMIRSLPDGYRESVLLSEIEGLPQRAVADHLRLSLSGAKSRIQRGRVMLKDVLDQCCRFEFDGRGSMIGYDPKPDRKVCRDCGE